MNSHTAPAGSRHEANGTSAMQRPAHQFGEPVRQPLRQLDQQRHPGEQQRRHRGLHHRHLPRRHRPDELLQRQALVGAERHVLERRQLPRFLPADRGHDRSTNSR